MENLWNVVHGLRPVLVMMLVQIWSAVMIIFYKLASEYGMPMKVLLAYRFMFASAAIVPLAYFLEREKRPKLTWTIVLQAFAGALFGGMLSQNMYAESLVLTSATFSTSMINLVPGITFIMAIVFRLEKLGLNSMAGKAKVVGTLTSIGGAMVLTIYKGSEVKIWSTNIDLMHKNEQQGSLATTHNMDHHKSYFGSLLALGSCFCVGVSYILRAKMTGMYPCHSCTALIVFFAAIQTVFYALCFERNWSQWKLGWDMRLLASVYAGVASGLASSTSMWCVQMRGPLFVSVFSPLMLINVAIASSLFLKEKLYLGSVLGAIIIISGLYIVLWGKSKEMKKVNQLIPSKSIGEAELGQCNIETKGIIPVNPLGVGPDLIAPIILSSDDDENNEIICEIETIARGREDP